MNAAICVKSPFSHSALFGFIDAPLRGRGPKILFKPVVLCGGQTNPSISERREYLLKRPAEADHIAQRLQNFAESPRKLMDAFSEILSGVKLSGAVFFNAEFSAPWGLSTPPTSHMVAELSPGAAHLVLYHFVLEGGANI